MSSYEQINELDFLRPKFPCGHPRFIPLCLEEMELHSRKNADYAHSGDPLGNFYRVSKILGLWGLNITPYLVALIYMLKQVDAVGRMLTNEYEGQVEGVKDRLLDISVYAKLIAILYEESKR